MNKILLKVTEKNGKAVSPIEVDEVLEKALRKMRGEIIDTPVPLPHLDVQKNKADEIFNIIMANMIDEIVEAL